MYNLRGNNRLKKFIKGGNNFARRQIKRPYKNVNVRRAVLCDSVYIVPAAVYARLSDGIDIRAELDGLSFKSATDIHGDFNLHFVRRSRFASICGRTRFKQTFGTCRRLLLRVAFRICAVEFIQGRDAKFQAIRGGKYFNRGADNLRRRADFNDFSFGRWNIRGNDNGGISVYTRRHFKSISGGISRREVAKSFRGTAKLTKILAEKIIGGDKINRSEAESLIDSPLEEVQRGAALIQKKFRGNHVDLCTIINGKSGRCSENCKYCAQSARHHTGIDEYDFLPVEKILAVALANEAAGVNRFSIVTSGRALDGKNFDKAIEAYKILRGELKTLELCASHGILSLEQLKRLKNAGVKRYHHNLETSRRFFPEICTSHTYDDRIKTIKLAQEVGLEVCSGGIIGMGETWQDRIDLAFELEGLKIKSIPINILTAIKGTALENMPRLGSEEILRTIAIFRYINPQADVRFAAGRKFLSDNGASALLHGASAAITGNMLTTSNNNIENDLKLLRELGLTNKEELL